MQRNMQINMPARAARAARLLPFPHRLNYTRENVVSYTFCFVSRAWKTAAAVRLFTLFDSYLCKIEKILFIYTVNKFKYFF